MGEYIYASFQCGGKIKREHAQELVDWGSHYRLTVDGDGGKLTIEDVGKQWSDSQVNYGNLDELLDFCKENGIDFEYYCAEGPEWDAETRKFIDGIETSFNCGQDGPWVAISELTKLDALASGWADFHEKIRRWKRELTPVELID